MLLLSKWTLEYSRVVRPHVTLVSGLLVPLMMTNFRGVVGYPHFYYITQSHRKKIQVFHQKILLARKRKRVYFLCVLQLNCRVKTKTLITATSREPCSYSAAHLHKYTHTDRHTLTITYFVL